MKSYLIFVFITQDTDIIYNSNNVNYCLYGIDYNSFFCFKHNVEYLLYNDKKHWRQEEKEKDLLI